MTESVLEYMTRLGRAAREASRVLARTSAAQKNRALEACRSVRSIPRCFVNRQRERPRRWP